MGFENYSKAAFQKNEQEIAKREELEAAVNYLIPEGASINGPDPRAEREALLTSAYEEALQEDEERDIDKKWELYGQQLQEKYRIADTAPPNLMPEHTPAPNDAPLTFADIELVETAKGSTYRYLPDGTTQRFKKVEGREYEPQSALVYVPSYEWVQAHAPQEVLTKLGENEAIYTDILLEYVQNPRNEGKGAYIIDGAGTKIETNAEIAATEGPIYLALTKGEHADFHIPVSRIPKVGYFTFDVRTYTDEKTGESMRERHLGNAVTRIVQKEKVPNTSVTAEDVEPPASLPLAETGVQEAALDVPNVAERAEQEPPAPETNPYTVDGQEQGKESYEIKQVPQLSEASNALHEFVQYMQQWNRAGLAPFFDRSATLQRLGASAEALATIAGQETVDADALKDTLLQIDKNLLEANMRHNGQTAYDQKALQKFGDAMGMLHDVVRKLRRDMPDVVGLRLENNTAALRDAFRKKAIASLQYLRR